MSVQVACILIGLFLCIAIAIGVKAWEMAQDMDEKDENKRDG